MSNSARLKIAFVGNCQVSGILAALRAMVPDAEVGGWHVGVSPGTGQEVAAELPRYDVVIKNIWDGEEGGLFDLSRLKERCAKVVWMPPVVFTGFHPDSIYMSCNGQLVPGLLGPYHSAIIAAAFSLDVPPGRVPALFNSLVYARLGYFTAFAGAKQEFLGMNRDHGYELADHFDRWIEAGAFMYTINHPRIDVLGTMATLAAVRAEVVAGDTPVPERVPDYLENGCQWPTYPELAKRIGVPGSMTFLRGKNEGETREIRLTEAIETSYARYANTPGLDFSTGRVGFVREGLKELLVIRQR
jgi:hypothetical protein